MYTLESDRNWTFEADTHISISELKTNNKLANIYFLTKIA